MRANFVILVCDHDVPTTRSGLDRNMVSTGQHGVEEKGGGKEWLLIHPASIC